MLTTSFGGEGDLQQKTMETWSWSHWISILFSSLLFPHHRLICQEFELISEWWLINLWMTTSALEKLRMKQYLSDQNFRPEMLLYLPQGVFRDVADLVPTGFFAVERVGSFYAFPSNFLGPLFLQMSVATVGKINVCLSSQCWSCPSRSRSSSRSNEAVAVCPENALLGKILHHSMQLAWCDHFDE